MARTPRKRRPGAQVAKRVRPRSARTPRPATLLLHGLHPVRAALANPQRTVHALHATANALARLEVEPRCPVRTVDTRELERMCGPDAVHQGVALECEPLERIDGSELFRLAEARLVLVLDQVTDPHNVGAILRSAAAMAADCVVVTARHAAPETGTLAKSASGALDLVPVAEVRNLGKSLEALREFGLLTIGLDSAGEADLKDVLRAPEAGRVALVLGAEGRGLREGTRLACARLARLDMPGAIRSLNVSNAAALALYLARERVDG